MLLFVVVPLNVIKNDAINWELLTILLLFIGKTPLGYCLFLY